MDIEDDCTTMKDFGGGMIVVANEKRMERGNPPKNTDIIEEVNRSGMRKIDIAAHGVWKEKCNSHAYCPRHSMWSMCSNRTSPLCFED